MRGFEWGKEHFDTVNSAENNIITLISNKHHQSTVHYFPWDNRGNYGMLDNSSVGAYARKSAVIILI